MAFPIKMIEGKMVLIGEISFSLCAAGMTTEEMMDVGMTADDCEALQAAIETVKAHGMHRKDSLLTTSTV